MNKRVNILYQCDNNFAFMAGVSFTSLLMHVDKDIDYYVYLLTPDMDEENREKWCKAISDQKAEEHVFLTFLDAKPCEDEVRSWDVPTHRGSWVTYYKLLLNRYFEGTDVDRIIHIGADTLVTGSLRGLVDFDFQGMPFAMNWSENMHFPRYPKGAKYCIAEMVYFNLPEWRRHNCEKRIIEHVKRYGDVYGSKDQGILCAKFSGEYTQLPLKYNVYGMTYYFSDRNKHLFNNAPIISDDELKDAYSNPEIIHIARTFLYRPCEYDTLDRMHDMWWEYCDRSPWRGMEPITPAPPLGTKEKIFRKLFQILPIGLAEWCYIIAKHRSSDLWWLIWGIKNGGFTPKEEL